MVEMRILVAIVHHWNPEGGGRHQSLRPDPAPRLEALRELILAFSRLGRNQFHFHFGDQAAYPANSDQRHHIDLHVITDGVHHLLDALDQPCRRRIHHVPTGPTHPLMLGFEAQSHLAGQLQSGYDLYAYVEDDLIIRDPLFFSKIVGFAAFAGSDCVLLPQRFELLPIPAHIDKLYIDGSMPELDLQQYLPEPGPPLEVGAGLLGSVLFESPPNPHAGCFVLTHDQLTHWTGQPWWLDKDCSFISPLESAATLGLLKTFRLYKPPFAQACWLEIQHWGTSFFSLLAHATPHRPEEHG